MRGAFIAGCLIRVLSQTSHHYCLEMIMIVVIRQWEARAHRMHLHPLQGEVAAAAAGKPMVELMLGDGARAVAG